MLGRILDENWQELSLYSIKRKMCMGFDMDKANYEIAIVTY